MKELVEREEEKRLNEDVIAFNRGKVLIANVSEKIVDNDLFSRRSLLLISLTKELEVFGYILSSEVLKSITEEEIERVYKNLIPFLVEEYHSGSEFKPVYPHFPEQVISKSAAELWAEQNKLYNGEEIDVDNWYGSSVEEIKRVVNLEELKPITEEEFNKIPIQLMSSNNSFSVRSKAELLWFLDNKSVEIPERIPFKETLCLVLYSGKQINNLEINDVLRFSFYIMGTDPSLPKVDKRLKSGRENPIWRNLSSLSRAWRNKICGMIEEVVSRKGLAYSIIDAKRFYGHWILLSERLHPGDFAKRYAACYDFFKTLKDKKEIKKYRTWQSQVQKMYDDEKDLIDITKKISERPGEFIRRFDSLIRRAMKNNKESEVMDIFIDTAGMKNKTLIELSDYYDKRDVVSRKVKRSDGTLMDLEKLEEMDQDFKETINDVICRKVLINIKDRVTEEDMKGKKVWLDPEIKKIPIPKGMRNSRYEIPVGTRVAIPENKNCIRFFVHWIDENGHEDLDLHAFILDDKEEVTNIGWNTSFADEHNYVVMSGDVRNRVGKCAEYIDIDIDKSKQEGYRYLVTSAFNYTGRGFDTLKCWLGYCFRDALGNSELTWYPDEVDQMVEIDSESSGLAAYIVDFDKREIILVNCSINSISSNQFNSNYQIELIKYFANPIIPRLNSYSVLRANYEARGAEILDQLPPEITDMDNDEKPKEEIIEVSFADIRKDFTKVLEALGE